MEPAGPAHRRAVHPERHPGHARHALPCPHRPPGPGGGGAVACGAGWAQHPHCSAQQTWHNPVAFAFGHTPSHSHSSQHTHTPTPTTPHPARAAPGSSTARRPARCASRSWATASSATTWRTASPLASRCSSKTSRRVSCRQRGWGGAMLSSMQSTGWCVRRQLQGSLPNETSGWEASGCSRRLPLCAARRAGPGAGPHPGAALH